MVKSAPRCVLCGGALTADAVGWPEAQQQAAARHVQETAAAVASVPALGYDAEGRARACKRLSGFFVRSQDRLEIVDYFLRGLARDFSLEQAERADTCACGRRAEQIVGVGWHARIDAGVSFGALNLFLLLFGVISVRRKYMEFRAPSYHAACAACSPKKGWFDRYERFFGKVPKILRVEAVERLPHEAPRPPAPAVSASAPGAVRGGDLRYDITITAAEETDGFSRTLQFTRRVATSDGAPAPTTPATEQIVLAAGWARGHARKQDRDHHYTLRLPGKGDLGQPAGNNGDLFVSITVRG